MSTDKQYCCEDFKDMLDEGYIELDNDEPRSRGWYGRQKYVLKCYSDKNLTSNAHVYMKYCVRCGTVLTT